MSGMQWKYKKRAGTVWTHKTKTALLLTHSIITLIQHTIKLLDRHRARWGNV